MLKRIIVLILVLSLSGEVFASSMFDANGNYTGNWKQMTNVKTNNSSAYKNSDFSSSTWYAQQNKKKTNSDYRQSVSSNKNDTVPYRYNTLYYTRTRQMQGADGTYKSKCSDIGDASFCY